MKKGSALYLALEDNPRRLQRRLQKLVHSGAGEHDVPQGFYIATQWPRVGDGCEEVLHEWLKEHPDARLIVVDTLKKIRPRANPNRSLYELDYEALEPLLPLAAEFGVGLVVVHHTRKLPGADVLDEISGSTGLSGGVDGALVLRRERGKHDATLFVTGRDVEEEAELALRWDTDLARWVVMGDAQEYRISEERRAVLEVLEKADRPLQPHEIITDRGYMRQQREWRKNVAEKAGCQVVQVESDVVVPVELASDKAETAARTLRPKIHKHLERFLVDLDNTPVEKQSTDMQAAGLDLSNLDSVLNDLDLVRSVEAMGHLYRSGTSQTKKILDDFIRNRFGSYTGNRNQPQTNDVSHMSKYLHFGQISPVYIALEIQDANASRENTDSYLEELIWKNS